MENLLMALHCIRPGNGQLIIKILQPLLGLSTMGIMRETLLRVACDQIDQGLRAK